MYQVRFHVFTAARMKMTAFWDIATCILVEVDLMTLVMQAVSIAETSVYLYETTRHTIPEGYHFQVRLSFNNFV
jgi:hypothetical protein